MQWTDATIQVGIYMAVPKGSVLLKHFLKGGWELIETQSLNWVLKLNLSKLIWKTKNTIQNSFQGLFCQMQWTKGLFEAIYINEILKILFQVNQIKVGMYKK